MLNSAVMTGSGVFAACRLARNRAASTVDNRATKDVPKYTFTNSVAGAVALVARGIVGIGDATAHCKSCTRNARMCLQSGFGAVANFQRGQEHAKLSSLRLETLYTFPGSVRLSTSQASTYPRDGAFGVIVVLRTCVPHATCVRRGHWLSNAPAYSAIPYGIHAARSRLSAARNNQHIVNFVAGRISPVGA
jgi:hypothetical protein